MVAVRRGGGPRRTGRPRRGARRGAPGARTGTHFRHRRASRCCGRSSAPQSPTRGPGGSRRSWPTPNSDDEWGSDGLPIRLEPCPEREAQTGCAPTVHDAAGQHVAAGDKRRRPRLSFDPRRAQPRRPVAADPTASGHRWPWSAAARWCRAGRGRSPTSRRGQRSWTPRRGTRTACRPGSPPRYGRWGRAGRGRGTGRRRTRGV